MREAVWVWQIQTKLHFLAVVTLFVGLSACSQAPIKLLEEPPPILSDERPNQDGPPLVRLDPTTIKDAIPKVEPHSRYGNPPHYDVMGKRYYPLRTARGYKKRGLASWYGVKFQGQRTSSGEPYDLAAMTAAHKTLPLPTYARITNLTNGRTTIVKINDRGPFHDQRIIDLSYAAAVKLGFADQGTAPVEVETSRHGALSASGCLLQSSQCRTAVSNAPT
ncbi:MAG: rare lipoprotein A [Halothiobacillaceae bacterium]|nr:MAG: rare lipoprotein A [Halothiobacillaceae bacterium]